MKKLILSLAIILTSITAHADYVPITLNVNTDHISVTELSHSTNGTWSVSADIKVPSNLIYDDIAWPARVDRQHWLLLPVELSDAQMQAILADNYDAVLAALSLGEYTPSRAIQEAIILAVVGAEQ